MGGHENRKTEYKKRKTGKQENRKSQNLEIKQNRKTKKRKAHNQEPGRKERHTEAIMVPGSTNTRKQENGKATKQGNTIKQTGDNNKIGKQRN
jgi:hypothetical protein